jgi:hypothetical protein
VLYQENSKSKAGESADFSIDSDLDEKVQSIPKNDMIAYEKFLN